MRAEGGGVDVNSQCSVDDVDGKFKSSWKVQSDLCGANKRRKKSV